MNDYSFIWMISHSIIKNFYNLKKYSKIEKLNLHVINS